MTMVGHASPARSGRRAEWALCCTVIRVTKINALCESLLYTLTRWAWQTGIERKTVYLPGEIRKYERTGLGRYHRQRNHLGAVMDDGDLSWPLPWLDVQGMPLAWR